MNEGIHLDLDTWIVPGQIRKANLCRGVGNRYTTAGTEVLISLSFNNNNNSRRLVTLAEHTSDHGKQTNSSTKEKGEHG